MRLLSDVIEVNFEALAALSGTPADSSGFFCPSGTTSSKKGDLLKKVPGYKKVYKDISGNLGSYVSDLRSIRAIEDFVYLKVDDYTNKSISVSVTYLPYQLPTFTFLGMQFSVINDGVYLVGVNNDYTILLADLGSVIQRFLSTEGSDYEKLYSSNLLKSFIEKLKMGDFDINLFSDSTWSKEYFSQNFSTNTGLYKSATISILSDSDLASVNVQNATSGVNFERVSKSVGRAFKSFTKFYSTATSVLSSIDSLAMAFKTLAESDIPPQYLTPSNSVASGFCPDYTMVGGQEQHSFLIPLSQNFVDGLTDGSITDTKEWVMASMMSPNSMSALGEDLSEFELSVEVYTAASVINMLKYNDPDLMVLGEEDPEAIIDNLQSVLGKDYFSVVNDDTDNNAFELVANILAGNNIIVDDEDVTDKVANIVHGDYKDNKFVVPDSVKSMYSIPRSGRLYKKIGDILVNMFDEQLTQ